ncbi:Nuclear pore complex, Nup160 component [Phytophthora cinnamomi]|uniref:Nuclear pore complex, Nup160 component n=1 Tax=Phytophthora cinnamomi TaxID=4785 RepID=UPI00355A4E47|nr:Nuclear pore complex, Nup160 component [Phytophthora cinnamomi]
MRPLLQEAQFACFEDDEGLSDVPSLSSFVVSSPAVRSQPPKSFARVRALECSGSGSFYFQNESLRDRFVCWRVLKNVVVLREWSLNTTLRQNGVRLEFPAPVVNTGVFAVESWEDDAVTINVVSHAGTIHRFTYAVPSDKSLSIFSQADAKAFPEPKPATRTRCDVLQVLNSDEILSVALWVNEYNLVLGTDSGRVLGVNFGLPSDAKKMQEFVFSDESVVSWLWNGLAAKFKGVAGEDGERRDVGAAIVAMTCFQMDTEEDEESESENGEKDVCVISVSADCVLRAWSFRSQSCLGRQQLRSLVTPLPKDEEEGDGEARWEDEDLDGDDGVNTLGVYATHAKVVALSPTESDNCRLLVHLDTTAAHSTEIFLLRGDVQPVAVSSAGASGEELALDTARVFTVQSNEQKPKRGLKMVDFAVDKNFLFSSWRSLDGDEVYIHPNPMALTGPKRIQGQLVSSLDVQMQKYEAEDSEWLFDLKEEGVMTMIDDFFAERILLPGRFSRQNLSNAIVEAQNGSLDGFSSQSPFTHRLPKYKDVLVRLVSSRCVDAAGAAAVRNGTAPSVLRIRIWKELIALCTKHWRCENVPIGFATTTNALLPGAPVMLRRNRVSLLFPSAPSITAAFVPQAEQGSSTAECVADLVSEVLPVFDAFPSQSFQSFIHREVADVASDWKVESFVALARHCVRLGLNPEFVASAPVTGQTISAELMLTRSILRLSKLLGGDAGFQDQVFRDLVEHLFPFELWRGSGAYKSSSPSSDEDEDMTNGTEDFTMADATVPADYYSTTRRAFFAGHEMCFAFDQVASRTIDEMCNQSLRVVLFLAYLVDTRPAFLSSATLSKIVQVYLPKSITVYQRWRLSRWVASQGITQSIADTDPAITSSATLMPPLLQMFLLDVNRKLNRSGNFKRALSVLQLASASNNVRSEEAHGVLATFTREILEFVSQPNDSLVRFLQKRQQFRLLRAMFCCNLSDISLHGSKKGDAASSQHSEQIQQYVRSIGECLACEGQEAATRAHDEEDARDHARWCFQQAIRCFSICLSNFFVERKSRSSRSEHALEQFIYDVVGLLKETVPRGFYDQLLSFLWTVVTQALSHLAHHDGGEQSFALQSFIWVNVFKYSVEERLFRDAHLALMHTAELSAALGGSETAADAEGTASECVNYLVKELYRYGHLDLICELQWGSLESHVEKYVLWQAANATVIHGDGLDAGAIRYYNLLFTFYMRKQQPANAASSLYALALRLRLAVSTSKAALEAQRNALNAACNALRALPVENRWVVRKLHTEELKRPAVDAAPSGSKSAPSLSVVTLEDMRRELSVLDGKLRLLALGHSESVLLSTMDSDEVIALLVDAVHSSCTNTGNTTLAERRRAGLLSIEIAADIAGRTSGASLSNLTKSLSRYCVASEHPAVSSSISRSDSDRLWDLLENLLSNVDKLEQYEIAAEIVLDFWQQQGRKLALPQWLYKRLASPTSGSPVKLLTLYLKHGLLLEALQLVEGLLPDAATMRGANVSNFQSLKKQSASLPELPWIPYNLIDALLDSTSAVLNQGAGGDVSVAAITRLRTQDHSLREQLSRYFRSANALQQAEEAAHLARSSIDLDL